MYKGKTFLAIIPARGGSKGIPRKNIIEVNGRPLIAYTIEPALQSKYLDRVIVSTDDKEISEVSLDLGADVPFLRPGNLATDEAKTIDALIYTLKNIDEKYDYVVLLQPTQPLRTVQQIDAAIEQIIDKNQESLISIKEVTEHPLLMRSIDSNGSLISLLELGSTVRRQDFEKYYIVDGSLYINKVCKLSIDTSLNDNLYPFIFDHSIDIDSQKDIEVFRQELTKGLKNTH